MQLITFQSIHPNTHTVCWEMSRPVKTGMGLAQAGGQGLTEDIWPIGLKRNAPSAKEGINKMRYVQAVEYYSALRRDERLTLAEMR